MLKTFVVFLLLTQLCSVSVAKDIKATAKAPVTRQADDVLQLATRYENGEGVSRDLTRARELYCDAASLGAPEAYFDLGWMYLNGRGVVRNDAIAAFWLRKAADRGIHQATNLLRLLPAAANNAQASCIENRNSHAHPPKELGSLVTAAANTAGIDPDLVMAIIFVESDFDPEAVSAKNARGLMQLTSETAKRFGVQDPFNVRENLRGGISFLGYLLKRFHGDVSLALAAYNAGEGAVDTWGGIPPYKETINYVGRVTDICTCSGPTGENMGANRPRR